MYVAFTIPLKDQKIRFEPGASNQPKFQRGCYRRSLCAYDAYGTLVSDNIRVATFAHCTMVVCGHVCSQNNAIRRNVAISENLVFVHIVTLRIKIGYFLAD